MESISKMLNNNMLTEINMINVKMPSDNTPMCHLVASLSHSKMKTVGELLTVANKISNAIEHLKQSQSDILDRIEMTLRLKTEEEVDITNLKNLLLQTIPDLECYLKNSSDEDISKEWFDKIERTLDEMGVDLNDHEMMELCEQFLLVGDE